MIHNKPVIGVAAPYVTASRSYAVLEVYITAVKDAGGIPVMLPESHSPEDAEALAQSVDGILIPGGPDINPLFYGEEPIQQLGFIKPSNDAYEIGLIKATRAAGKPILGVCRGAQIVNVAFGGDLYQDLNSQVKGAFKHRQADTSPVDATHTACLKEGSVIRSIYGGSENILINSFHHQAVRTPAPGFTVTATAKDGIIECVEKADENILCIQWHPEEMQQTNKAHLVPFSWLVNAAAK